jgi:hypothetical protein
MPGHFFAVVLAALTAREAIQAHSYLLGSWTCTFTVGDDRGTYRTAWSKVLDGTWLEQTYDQPKQPRAQPFKAQYLIGYDESRATWVRFGAMTTGQYFAIRMTDTPDGWGWKYASFFPSSRARSAKYDATFTRKSDGLYTVDGPTYPNAQGILVTEHHQCRKD